MRVVVVSAHYPPNFVSGGTLQPQRLARGLRDRGHDVSVYAGWLGDRPPLESWSDVDETGMPVRWVVTTPWTSWSDRRNYDNPAVARDFAEHLSRVRPDIVHLHALQSLGAGLVSVAKQADAKVVVTMHDFWWSCARQFLVTRDMKPCCLVVDAGECPCDVSASWLRERNERTRAALAGADAILAPSSSMARALAANGVPALRLAVNENGLPPVEPGSGGRTRGSELPEGLRVVYTGGASDLKGAHVLVAAADALAGRDDVTITAYGLSAWFERADRSPEQTAIRLLAPFSPEALPAVLDSADVVVVPSVARESHSLITREALARGVPVVTSDCLGPEEVVEHERNGLVVPSGDAMALARALGRLVDEEGLLSRLSTHATAEAPVTVDDQVDQLEDIYRSLVRTETCVPESKVRRVVFIVGIEGAPLRYRARLPAESMALLGVRSDVRHYRDPDLPALVALADVVVVYRVPATPQVLYLLSRARAMGTPSFFDVDDLVFDPDILGGIPALARLPADELRLYTEGVHRYRTTLEACDAFIGSTVELCEYVTALTGLPAARFANGVGIQLGRLSDQALRSARDPGPLRIGYFSGTSTHDDDWRSVESAVVEVMRGHPDVELWLGGHLAESDGLLAVQDRVRRLPFVSWTVLPGVLRQVDVNIAPLATSSRFNDAKSAIKWLEAALVETVTVASPTQPFREAVRHGVSGMLAETADEWTQALSALVQDVDLRARLGRRAKREALLELSPHLQGARYLAVLERGREHMLAPRAPSTWVPLANDEPVMLLTLEPYDGTAGVGHVAAALTPLRARLSRSLQLVRIARVMVRESGVRETAKRATGYVRRRVVSRTG